MALCRLHNYCIDSRIRNETSSPGNEQQQDVIPRSLAADSLEIVGHGGIPLIRTRENQQRPEQLLDAGNHNDDTSFELQRSFSRHGLGRREILPRERLHDMVASGGFKRPTPKKWQSSSI
jgi:hypothetical protein